MISSSITEQELFDTVYTGLQEQGRCSMDTMKNNSCRYRLEIPGGKVLKCAVGLLLTDDEYDEDMEGDDAQGLVTHHTLPSRLREHQYFLEEMQRIHDDAASMALSEQWEIMREGLVHCARVNGLNVPK